jgi:hypothetical protein
MSEPNDKLVSAIDRATLTPLVRRALRNESAEVVDWTYHPLYGGVLTSSGGPEGIYRFTGRAQCDGASVPWSLVFKYSREDRPDNQRERRAYQSGVLQNLPGGLTAPQCYGVVEQPGELYALWLEDIKDEFGRWPLEQYAVTARHFGQFHGAYLTGDSFPAWPWLSRHWLRHFVSGSTEAVAQLPSALEHPLVRRFYPDDVAEGILRLWDERDQFLDALDRLPQTLCHLDASRRNLFARRGASGQAQTVAIDWTFVGWGPVSIDLASVVIMSVGFNEADLADLRALEALAFESYLTGLHEAGWQGDPNLVWFGYVAAAAMRYGLGVVGYPVYILTDETKQGFTEQLFHMPVIDMADLWGAMQRHVLGLAEEARILLGSIQ